MATSAAQYWGARQTGKTDWSFALWVPDAAAVDLELDGSRMAMTQDHDGTYRLTTAAQAGLRYRFFVDGQSIPDPAARQQQGDVHGDSILTDMPVADNAWRGRDWRDAVISEIHIGTFTQAGTFAAAAERLADLAALGINTVEVMPIAQFAGHHGWGYDGVLPYAPHPSYGSPADFAAFVAAAHGLGMSVILDVVYNHFGPDGAYLHGVCPAFFEPERQTPWGAAIDFTKAPVRAFFIENAVMWMQQFSIDGLRLDAVHQIMDPSTPHFIQELSDTLRGLDLPRPVHLIAEDERNLPDDRDAGATDAQWNDDYHHSLHCLLTNEAEGYYAPFAINPIADLAVALTEGHVAQGQPRHNDPHDGPPRGAPSSHLPPWAFVNANQTHDQIGNRALGERLIALADPRAMSVAHMLLLTAPFVPMLFQGEEIGARTPFPFFCDFSGDLADAVRKGRLAEFAAFGGFGGALPDPLDSSTFASARPYDDAPGDQDDWRNLTRAALDWRRGHVLPLLHSGWQSAQANVLGPKALSVTWRFDAGAMHAVAQFGQSVPARYWPKDPAGLRLGTPDSDFAFCIWTTHT